MEKLKIETATLAGGCFWCLEAAFNEIKGVIDVISGYSGGHIKNPSYQQVCNGDTGHAEVVQVQFDPQKMSFDEILEVFFSIHDPTTSNRQGNDVGTQYRSAIFYHSEAQHQVSLDIIEQIQQSWSNPIVTEVVPFKEFFPAEEEHQKYFERHPNQGYCSVIIAPKIAKMRKNWQHKLKNS